MTSILDCFSSIRKRIHFLDGDRPSSPVRRTVRPQLESLEDRVVPSVTISEQPPNLGQVFQQLQFLIQLAQIETNPGSVGPQGILNTLGNVVQQLPGISQNLNNASGLLTQIFGPQLGQQYTGFLITGVEFLLTNLETEAVISNDILDSGGTGIPQNENLNVWIQAINYFLSNPLNDPYSVPPGAFGG
jgi:hypothetical protein